MNLNLKFFAVALLGFVVFVQTGRAETVSFPKDKPALTLELPAGLIARFGEHGALTVVFQDKVSIAQLSEIDSCPSDEEAIQRVTKEAHDSLIGYETNEYISKKEKLTDGIMAVHASVGGMYPGHERSAPESFAEVMILWVNGKRCFLLSSVHDMAGMKHYLALRQSLKPGP